jgi:NAD(P)-dependent dehydrogenase (short-subunit alcohol dehydrogenase family)
LAGTGVTVNSLQPGAITASGMIPDQVSDEIRKALLDPAIMVPPLIWLASYASDGFTGERVIATKWDSALPPDQAAARAREPL